MVGVLNILHMFLSFSMLRHSAWQLASGWAGNGLGHWQHSEDTSDSSGKDLLERVLHSDLTPQLTVWVQFKTLWILHNQKGICF